MQPSSKITSNFSSSNSLNLAYVILLFSGLIYLNSSQYPLTILFATGILILMVKLLPLKNIPPVLLFFYVFHFLQIIATIFYSDFKGMPISQIFSVSEEAFLMGLTLIQLLIIVFIVSRVKRDNYIIDKKIIENQLAKIDLKKTLYVYGISTVFLPILIKLLSVNASLAQLFGTFAIIRYVLFIILVFKLFFINDQKNKITLRIIIVIEFLLSFISFFSSFKYVLLYIFLVFLTINPKIKSQNVLGVSFGMIFIFVLFSFWSNVKGDYRQFVSQGSNNQTVNVDGSQAFEYLTERASKFSWDEFNLGNEIFLSRLQYMEQYLAVTKMVPRFIKYQDGDNLLKTLIFVFVPRFFNEEKGTLDPSTKTSYYTGKPFKKASEGTSISMGYFAEMYLDYGFYFMIIPLIFIALAIVLMYNWVLNNKKYNLIFNFGLLIAIFPNIGSFESDSIFFLGILKNYVIMILVGNWFVFPYLNKAILTKEEQLRLKLLKK